MKYIILLGDGMGDYPIPELNNKTPLEAASKPNIDSLSKNGLIGRVRTVPPGFASGSDVTNLVILGYDPVKYYSGRSPLEAASMGIHLNKDDMAYRCNLVTLKDKDGSYEIDRINSYLTMDDYSAGHITTDEAKDLIYEINEVLGTEEIQFYPGVSYRHLMVMAGGKKRIKTYPPHDILGKKVKNYLPSGEDEEILKDLIDSSIDILAGSQVNEIRIKEGKKPANSIWLWGQGRPVDIPSINSKYGIRGSMISAVDLMNGIGTQIGLNIINVPGVTGYLDTNYRGKAEHALAALKKEDIVYLHVEAPDEASHNGDLQSKIRAIEDFDREVVGTIVNGMKEFNDYRILVLCDHMTPVSKRTHTDEPVPFLLYDSRKGNLSGMDFNEANASKSNLFFENGVELMPYFLEREES